MASRTVENFQLELRAGIEETGCCEVVALSSRKGDIRVMFRVKDLPKWYGILSIFLLQEDRERWYSFIGQKYLLHEGKLTAVWVMFVDSPENIQMHETVRALRTCLGNAVYQSVHGIGATRVEVGPDIVIPVKGIFNGKPGEGITSMSVPRGE